MSQIQWEYYFSRKFTAHRYEIVMNFFSSDFCQKYFGVCLQNILVVPQAKNSTIYMDKAEWRGAQKKIYETVCKDWKTFQKFKKMLQSSQKHFYEVVRETANKVSPHVSNKSLLKLYQRAMDSYQDFFNKPIWIIFPIEPLLCDEAEKELDNLVKKLKQIHKQQEYFGIIFSPDKMNAIVREREDLLKIIIAKKQGKAIDALLQQHVKKFGWIPCYDPVDEPWNIAYFQSETEKILLSTEKLEEELQELQFDFKHRKKIFQQFLSVTPLNQRQKEIFQMAHETCFLKDERDDFRRLCSFWLKPLFIEIGRRAGLNLKETANLLRNEVEVFLTSGILPPIATIKERVNGYVLLRKYGQDIKVYSGAEVPVIIKQELGEQTVDTGTLNGIIGSKGITKGQVQVVITKHDLRKVKQGDVLVAVTTHPDFVPAMQRASAFVTDEGGLTCHAAIVAREMKKPCIVGTKFATTVLQDGDMVEVDADKGIVKKI